MWAGLINSPSEVGMRPSHRLESRRHLVAQARLIRGVRLRKGRSKWILPSHGAIGSYLLWKVRRLRLPLSTIIGSYPLTWPLGLQKAQRTALRDQRSVRKKDAAVATIVVPELPSEKRGSAAGRSISLHRQA